MPKKTTYQMLVNGFEIKTVLLLYTRSFMTVGGQYVVFVLFLATPEKTHGSVVQMVQTTWM